MFGRAHMFLLLLVLSVSPSYSENTNYLLKLDNQEQFLMLAGKPLSEKYSGTKAVKVVLDLRKHQLYFISAKAYRYHRDFCIKVLGNTDELSEFNYKNYRSGHNRRYVFSTINFYPERELYTLEFSDIERFSTDVISMFKYVKAKSYIGQNLRLHPRTDAQLRYINKLEEPVKTITANELYQGVSKQMLVKGSAIGRLRKINIDTLGWTKINPWDIVLTNGSPNDIDLCAGLIITKFQSPLSHINILCHNRGTPVVADKDAFDDKELVKYLNRAVRFEVADEYKVSSASTDEFNQIVNSKITFSNRDLRIDKDYEALKNIQNFSHRDVARIGGKAANLAELYRVRRLNRTCDLPEKAFAIPMTFYLEHFKASGAEKMLNDLLLDSAALDDKKELNAWLKKIRNTIKNVPISKTSLLKIKRKIYELQYANGARIRFRSSTNAEDIKGFNGAGLYGSYTGVVGNISDRTVEQAIKKVWASTWNESAFRERQYFGINQKTVAMGILVHKAFGTEDVNGVVITKNLYRKNDEAFVVNAQKGEVAIVDGTDTATAQLSILSKSYSDEKLNHDYISYSSLNDEKPLLTYRQLDDLFTAVQRIKYHYYFSIKQAEGKYADYGLDVEFKIKNGRVIIKQVRPFN